MASPQAIEAALKNIHDQPSFVRELLARALEWPIREEVSRIEDISFGWRGEELQARDLEKKVLEGGTWQIQPFCGHQPWGIFLLEFNNADVFTTGRGMTTPLRSILRGLVPRRRASAERSQQPAWNRENLLFICTYDYRHFRFAYFKSPTDGGKTAPLATFGWNEGDTHVRTLCEYNLPALAFPSDGGRDGGAWVSCWRSAFDVEAVTRRFFEEYREVFNAVEEAIDGVPKGEPRRLYTQRLFNRLMFLYFVQRKGWLSYKGNTKYLRAIFEDAKAKGQDFLNDRLYFVFFHGLNRSRSSLKPKDLKLLSETCGDVPYLNGGLFEELEDRYDVRDAVTIPNECFEGILSLFERYNFTVTESTPLDIEVAVDPEMLGRVFEELVTGRHETGSYYTPRPVVAFMCREALKGYLGAKCSANAQALDALVERHDPAGLTDSDAREILSALDNVKAVDPACGSGAYLLGLLQEMIAIYRCLYSEKLTRSARSLYELKMRIVSRNLYGVDIDEFAVNIARLRLWLSLAVEAEEPLPLPNLDFKIEEGDTLTAPNPQAHGNLDTMLVRGFQEAKSRYMNLSEDNAIDRSRLRKEIDKLRSQIASWMPLAGQSGAFDLRVECAEVFHENGGFDIVLANPPYVRADAQFKHIADENDRQAAIAKWRSYRDSLKKSRFYETLYEKWDLYIPFLERAYQLLAENGQMVFIISDAYNMAKYAKKSHEFFVNRSRIERVDFCTEIPLFDAGVNNTIVHFANLPVAEGYAPVRVRRWGQSKDDFEGNHESLPAQPQRAAGRVLFRPQAVEHLQAASGLVPLGRICYVSVGMVVHCDEKKAQGLFKAEDLVSDEQDGAHPKPYIEGKDVARWSVRRVRYLEYGTRRAPEMFRRPTFAELHEASERLLSLRMCGDTPAVAYDDRQLYSNHTAIIFVAWRLLRGVRNKSITKTAKYENQVSGGDREERERTSAGFELKYLLAVMNSGYARRFLNAGRRNKLDIYPRRLEGAPYRPAPDGKAGGVRQAGRRNPC